MLKIKPRGVEEQEEDATPSDAGNFEGDLDEVLHTFRVRSDGELVKHASPWNSLTTGMHVVRIGTVKQAQPTLLGAIDLEFVRRRGNSLLVFELNREFCIRIYRVLPGPTRHTSQGGTGFSVERSIERDRRRYRPAPASFWSERYKPRVAGIRRLAKETAQTFTEVVLHGCDLDGMGEVTRAERSSTPRTITEGFTRRFRQVGPRTLLAVSNNMFERLQALDRDSVDCLRRSDAVGVREDVTSFDVGVVVKRCQWTFESLRRLEECAQELGGRVTIPADGLEQCAVPATGIVEVDSGRQVVRVGPPVSWTPLLRAGAFGTSALGFVIGHHGGRTWVRAVSKGLWFRL